MLRKVAEDLSPRPGDQGVAADPSMATAIWSFGVMLAILRLVGELATQKPDSSWTNQTGTVCDDPSGTTFLG